MALIRRIAPALLLVVLAPIVAEFLLGDFTVRSLGLVVVFLAQYGGGALLVREVARRTGRGWPTMLLLALAYALVEEGLTTQSLFNPHYLGLRLLDYGYVPALGISTVWTVFVLSIHVVWSISTPILIVEGVAGERHATPWLGRVGLAVTAVLYVLGCLITTAITQFSSPYVASLAQLLAVAVLVVLAVAAALLLFRPGARPAEAGSPAPPPWLVGLAALVLAVAFEAVEHAAPGLGVPASLTALGMLACELVAVLLIATWSRGRGWGSPHTLVLATAAVLTYGGVGLRAFLTGRTNVGGRADAVDVAGQVVEVLAILALIAWAARRGGATVTADVLRAGA